ncbi:MAG: rhamnulokinase, partial [Terrimicrobiaceae bacterium]
MKSHYIACDLGAESGRVILGTLEAGVLTLEEIHRFPNLTIRLGNSIRWDILRTFFELKEGLGKIAARRISAASLSVDSWGVDYVWSGFGQPMLAPAYIYRDPRTDTTFERALATVGREKIFAETGIQFMSINTLYQLVADMEASPELVRQADGFL